MQIHIPDPAYTGSQRSRDNFRLAVKLSLGFVALLWLVHILNWGLDLGPGEFGVRPRQIAGLVGSLVGGVIIVPFGIVVYRVRYWASAWPAVPRPKATASAAATKKRFMMSLLC